MTTDTQDTTRLSDLHDHIITLAAQLADRDAEIARLAGALESVIAETGAIWDDGNPVHPAHGSRLDTMLFAAKTAIAAPSAADRDHAGESGE